MKTNKLTIASIITCIFALTACAGDLETGEVTLTDLEGSTYQQALTPDGDVDCNRLHRVLREHGIDPTMLDPEVVLEACVSSGDVSDLQCQRVAYTCFGPNACDDDGRPGIDPVRPDDDWCQMVIDGAAQSGIDPDDLSGDEVFERCIEEGYGPELCARVEHCFAHPVRPAPSPDPDMCMLAREEAERAGIDVDSLTDEEALELCARAGYDDQLCWQLVNRCLGAEGSEDGHDPSRPDDNADGSTDPDAIDCDEVERRLRENGIAPTAEDGSELSYDDCVQRTNDDALCRAALHCG